MKLEKGLVPPPGVRHEVPAFRQTGFLFGLVLLAVLVSFPLGMLTAATGAWFAIRGGSLLYLPLGLAFMLAGLAVLRSRSIADLIFLIILVAALIAWLGSGIDAKTRLLSSATALYGRVDLLFGLLVMMVTALFILHWSWIFARPVHGLRLLWIGIPLLLLTAGSLSFASLALASGFVR